MMRLLLAKAAAFALFCLIVGAEGKSVVHFRSASFLTKSMFTVKASFLEELHEPTIAHPALRHNETLRNVTVFARRSPTSYSRVTFRGSQAEGVNATSVLSLRGSRRVTHVIHESIHTLDRRTAISNRETSIIGAVRELRLVLHCSRLLKYPS